MDVEVSNTSFNLTIDDNQLMNKGVIWRGRQGKDFKSIEVFIKALIEPRVMALDAYISTNDCNRCLLIIPILENVFSFLGPC
jgi:hypothetical protein